MIKMMPVTAVIRKAKSKDLAAKGKAAKIKLVNYLNAAKPEPMQFLQGMWKGQQNQITFSELQAAIVTGQINPAWLSSWQQAYNDAAAKMKQVYIDSMNQASVDLLSTKTEFKFDPQWPQVTKWIENRGAEFVTNSYTEQKDAVASMLARSYTRGDSVDEAAKFIRPCIGLTKQQSEANDKLYQHVKTSLMANNPTMKEPAAKAKALEASTKYASKQLMYRADTIATTEMAFAYNRGELEAVKQAQAEGYMGKVKKIWSTAGNSSVCAICQSLDGTEINDMDGEFNFLPTNKAGIKKIPLFAGQEQTPPAHPRCECAIVYEEEEAPTFAAQPAAEPEYQDPVPDNVKTGPVPAEEEPPQPEIPKTIQMPAGMTDHGNANIGGTGEIHACTDDSGKEWLFKPAQSKSGTPETFRAYSQEAGYKVQGIVDPNTAVQIGTGDINGKFGAYQERITTDPNGFNLRKWQIDGGSITPQQIQSVQRENVTDWLLGNFDSHGGNFITNESGELIGIDKEQSFRYISDSASHTMSYSYHPNKAYGETEPVYNTLYRRFAHGEIDMNLQDSLSYIKRVEAIPDTEYREIFRDYAEDLVGKGKKAENLLDQIVERKQTLREDYRKFFTDLLTERTGKKQAAFAFADELGVAAQPAAGSVSSTAALTKMNKAGLLQMAKKQAIPYYNNMSKQQLIDSLTDPTKAKEASEAVRARLAANATNRAAAAAAKTPKTNLPGNAQRAEDVFNDISIIPKQKDPIPIWSDKDAVEGLNLKARKMTIDGKDYYEISGKLREEATNEVLKITGTNGKIKTTSMESPFETNAGGTSWVTNPMSDTHNHNPTVRRNYYEKTNPESGYIEIYDSKTGYLHAWDGYFKARIPVTGSSAADTQKAKELFDRFGMGYISETPSKESEELFKRARFIRWDCPHESGDLGSLSGKSLENEITRIVKDKKIPIDRTAKMELQELSPGYISYVIPGTGKDLQNQGLKYVITSMDDEEYVVKAIKSGEVTSTTRRIMQGERKPGGASMGIDIKRGGSDSVFSRVVTNKGHNDKIDGLRPSVSGRWRFIYSNDIMDRTDCYAFNGDVFGETEKIKTIGMSTKELVKYNENQNNSFEYCNEVCFRDSISTKYAQRIECQTSDDKDSLMQKFIDAGISEINGVPLDKFLTISDIL